MPRSLILFNLILLFSLNTLAQVPQNSELFKSLKSKDSLLFDVGFNNCDIKQFENLISNDFEFFHDISGITSSRSSFISNIKSVICRADFKVRRALVEESLEVYPLKKYGVLYGAIQLGRHCFYELKTDSAARLTSIARFTHLWLIEKGEWKLSRVFSYEHHTCGQDMISINEKLLFIDKPETEKWLLKNRIPALGIGYIEDGIIKEIKVYGELEKGMPAPANTIWNVASLTKPVSSLVVLKLVNAGLWNLDEPICHYWIDPDVASDPRARKLTTRHILSHQSGFPNWRDKNHDGKLAFEFEPGSRHQYSGEGFEYLRKALEKKFNKSLNELADSLIFKPLGMTDTRYYWNDSVDGRRFARWHDGNGNLYQTYKNQSENAADDLLTSIEDYSKFVLHIMNGAGLTDTLFEEMLSVQVRLKPGKYWGLGWWVDENIGVAENALLHGGDDRGVHTIAIILPSSRQGLIIFTNSDNGTDIYIPVILKYLGSIGQQIIDIETR